MAKELHNWGRYIMLGIVIIFSGGGWVTSVMNNSKSIQEEKSERVEADKILTVKVDKNSEDVVDLKLQYKDLENIASSTDESLREIKSTNSRNNEILMEQRVEIAEIKKDVSNLIRE